MVVGGHETVTQAEKDAREQKISTLTVLALALIGAAIMIYGLVVDSTALPILGFVIAMPMTLAFLINLGAYFMGSRRQSPPR